MQNLTRLAQHEEGERRHSPRYFVPAHERIIAGLAVIDPDACADTFTGLVRNVSESGLAILLPKGEACRGLTAHGPALAVVFALPPGVIKFRAEVAHCSARSGLRGGYLVGVRVTEMDAADYDRLAEYVEERS